MRTISNNKPNETKQSAPDQLKTDQEILEELKAASGGERKRSFGLTAFIVLLAIVIGVFTYMNRKDDKDENNTAANNATNNVVAVEEPTNTASEESNETSETIETTETLNQTPTTSSEAPGEKPTELSTRSQTAYSETAQVGEGVTHLARRALAVHLRENSISDLTAEHKIFVEDYLAKQSGYTWIDVGTTSTFEKTSVDEAVTAARALTPAQLQNLEQYSALVPGL
ncbi:MAG: hypothetical protein V1895_00560 [Parcubacteria group bacterium]